MKLDRLENILAQFPHWLDKNPYSNFTRLIRVLNRQELDKYHKIETLNHAKRINKPITIHKVQQEPYIYDIVFQVLMDNLWKVNVYVNPVVNNKEEIISYEKCLTKEYDDNGYNRFFTAVFHGDTRKQYLDNTPISWDEYTKGKYDDEYVLKEGSDGQIIPQDLFIIECLTYDDYRWLKGYPENDNTELFRIYREDKSYTHYLSFEIAKQNIRKIQIWKDDELKFEQVLFKYLKSEKGGVIFHDYMPKKRIGDVNYEKNIYSPEDMLIDDDVGTYYYDKDMLISDVTSDDDTNHKFQIILKDDDFYPVFDWTAIEKQYPDHDSYIIDNNILPDESTMGKVVVKYENDKYNAYETVLNEGLYVFKRIWYDLPYTLVLKNSYDLKVYLYDKYRPGCNEANQIITKRYNGYDKNNYDCFTHDYSLDMIGRYWNIPRLKFITKDETDNPVEYYKKTEPAFNDRLTEDDYHYQQRIKKYIYGYNKEHFPVLELWKNYSIKSRLFNRKDILSRMDRSYLCEKDYFLENLVRENTENKLDVVDGESNMIKINQHVWHESVICSNLFVVPDTSYELFYELSLEDEINDAEPPTIHLYYLDRKGFCHHEEKITPEFNPTFINSYFINQNFKTPDNACKLDIVLEYDEPFKYNNAYLKRVLMVSSNPLYMTTKTDYNSCVYELEADYKDIPSNIDFTNDHIFEKLLQRSLPITHKGYLNVELQNDESDEPVLLKEVVDFELINFFSQEYTHDENSNSYNIVVNKFIKEACNYHLKVTFINDEINETCDDMNDLYIYSSLKFNKDFNSTDESIVLNLPRIQCNRKTTLHYNFTVPLDMNIMSIKFESNTTFNYTDLSLTREESITNEELW